MPFCCSVNSSGWNPHDGSNFWTRSLPIIQLHYEVAFNWSFTWYPVPSGPSNSGPTFSGSNVCSLFFQSGNLPVPHFLVLHFQSTRCNATVRQLVTDEQLQQQRWCQRNERRSAWALGAIHGGGNIEIEKHLTEHIGCVMCVGYVPQCPSSYYCRVTVTINMNNDEL